MRRPVSSVNSGIPVQKFIKEFNTKDAMYCVANARSSVTTSTLRNGWHKLWPSLMFNSHSEEKMRIILKSPGFQGKNSLYMNLFPMLKM